MASLFKRYKEVQNAQIRTKDWKLEVHWLDVDVFGLILMPVITEMLESYFFESVEIKIGSTTTMRDCSSFGVNFKIIIGNEKSYTNLLTINEYGVLKSKTRIYLGDKNKKFVETLIDGIDWVLIDFCNLKLHRY